MSLFWTLIAILVAVIWVITLIDLFRRHLGAGPTIGWVLLVILLPFVGSIIYWIVRKPSRTWYVDEITLWNRGTAWGHISIRD